jgi:hypothetical protein
MRLLRAKRTVAALVLIASGGLGMLGAAQTASASVRLGGVDMQRACTAQWSNPYGPVTAVVLDQHNAFSWKCRSNYTGVLVGGIDVNRECVLQYGYGAYAGLGSTSNPYSWYCQR